MDKVTIYTKGEIMGHIIKIEARTATIRRRAWAQYENAIEVRYVKKGARKERGFVASYRPHIIVIEGHGHPDPAGIFDGGRTGANEDGSVTFTEAKYTGCSDGYARDFDAMIGEYIARTGAKVVFDARGEDIA